MITINVYRCGGEWQADRWVGGEYDGCDGLDLDASASEEEAIAEAQAMPLLIEGEREVRRVADLAL